VKVRCIANTGKDLIIKTPEKFPINIGEEYAVYSMLMCRGHLNYLLSNIAHWYPAELFEILDNSLPPTWFFEFSIDEDESFQTAIWGYKEMIFNSEHHDALFEREPEALEVFQERKKEIDKWQELRSQKST